MLLQFFSEVITIHENVPCFRLLWIFFSLDTGVKLTLSALVDGKNFNAGGHQLGLGLDFEAWAPTRVTFVDL